MVVPRAAKPTIGFVDDYCQYYQALFAEVRSFEAFKRLHVGMISEVKRKSLPAIAKTVGLANSQSLQHFLCESPWSADELRQWRLALILHVLAGRSLVLIIDETGDRKKGKTTDYVKRQYIGNLGKVENGIVAVTAYGLLDGIAFPLTFEVYKPKACLKDGETYRTKPEIACAMIEQLCAMGFCFELVLADSLYGESGSTFVSLLHKRDLPYILAIRSNHAVLLPKGQYVRCNRWRAYVRTFSDDSCQKRYIREIIYGKRREVRFWQLTTDPDTLPAASTWMVMTHVEDITYKQVGDLYGLRNWVEYGLKQSKNELGWADFRFTDYEQIEKWWEVVMSAYLMVTLHTSPMRPLGFDVNGSSHQADVISSFVKHRYWNEDQGWKSALNNLRLIALPYVSFNQIKPWLEVFPIAVLEQGFDQLIVLMNRFRGPVFNPTELYPLPVPSG